MKRALGIFGVIGLTALISYLVIARQQAQERAERLDRALPDAEARLKQGLSSIRAQYPRQAFIDLVRVSRSSPWMP
jgi:hypothetical protein